MPNQGIGLDSYITLYALSDLMESLIQANVQRRTIETVLQIL